MFRILVIAQSESKSKQVEKLYGDKYQLTKVYPNATTFSRDFQGMLVYLSDNSDLNFIKDLLNKYKNVPIKAFLGKESAPEGNPLKAQAFKIDQVDQVHDYLKKQYESLTEIMKKSFKAFDLDNSGYIDINELKDISKELGCALDAQQLSECMLDLD